MDKYFIMSYLLDIYSPLLTKKQAEVLDLYYNYNLSLAEISEIVKTSRQGVHDLLKRAENKLLNYDKKLNLLDKYQNNIDRINKIEHKLNQLNVLDENINNLIIQIKENL